MFLLIYLVLLKNLFIDNFFWSIEININSNFSPYKYNIVKIEKRAKCLIGILNKELFDIDEAQREISLIPEELENEIYKNIFTLKESTLCEKTIKSKDSIEFDIEINIDYSKIFSTCLIFPQEFKKKRIYFEALSKIFDVFRKYVEEPAFPNIVFTSEDKGYLHVFSTPNHKVLIDGIETNLKLPVFYYPIKKGKHTITLIEEKTGIRKTYDFTIFPGATTILNLIN